MALVMGFQKELDFCSTFKDIFDQYNWEDISRGYKHVLNEEANA